MSTPRPHANSRQIDAEMTSDLMKKSKLLSQLLPDPPAFTVVIAIAFPHDVMDIEDEESEEENIQQSQTFYIKAANVHTAIDMAMAQSAEMMQEEGFEYYSLMCCGAFSGTQEDLSQTYSYKKSGLFDEEEALNNMDIDTYTS